MFSPNPHLVALCTELEAHGYRFTTVTPATHERVVRRDARVCSADSSPIISRLRDVFGWNRPFTRDALPEAVFELLKRGELLEPAGEHFRSRIRVSSLGAQLFVHGRYPTTDADSVFFGPDSYRFCALVDRALGPCALLADVGCGSGVGGIAVSRKAQRVILADINNKALHYAATNAAINRCAASVVQSDVLAAVNDPLDAVIANPPYMRDVAGRTYRDGGGTLGEGLALRITHEALLKLRPGGTLVLYTGSAIVDGEDRLKREATALCREADASFEYSEIDPDVFGEELAEATYGEVERIAAIALVARIRSTGNPRWQVSAQLRGGGELML